MLKYQLSIETVAAWYPSKGDVKVTQEGNSIVISRGADQEYARMGLHPMPTVVEIESFVNRMITDIMEGRADCPCECPCEDCDCEGCECDEE